MSRIIVIVAVVVGVAAMAEASGSKPHRSLGPIKQIGDQTLSVALHTDVVVSIKVSVLGEQA